MKVAIVVLNYNGLDGTLDCLDSLKKLKNSKHRVKIFVVDNNSSDGSKESLSQLKDIILIKNDKNLGYSGGNNVGIKEALKSGSDYVLILNNDTIVDENLVENLLLAKNSGDIICPKIYFASGYEFHKERYKKTDLGKVIWYAGAKIDWQNIIGKHTGVDAVDNGQFSKRRQIDLATGACLLVSKKVFKEIGIFDEDYFLYLEDMDFSFRAQKANFKIIFEPKAILWHKNASSVGGSGSDLQDYFISRNRLLFAKKYAKLRTKLAVFRQIAKEFKNPIKRMALVDFLTCKLGPGSYLKQ